MGKTHPRRATPKRTPTPVSHRTLLRRVLVLEGLVSKIARTLKLAAETMAALDARLSQFDGGSSTEGSEGKAGRDGGPVSADSLPNVSTPGRDVARPRPGP